MHKKCIRQKLYLIHNLFLNLFSSKQTYGNKIMIKGQKIKEMHWNTIFIIKCFELYQTKFIITILFRLQEEIKHIHINLYKVVRYP